MNPPSCETTTICRGIIDDLMEAIEQDRARKRLEETMIYVDDLMGILQHMAWGTRFREGRLVWDEEAEKADSESGRCRKELTRTICLEMLNSISPNLQFTAEMLPTLDFKLRMGPDGTIQHSFYEKKMNTNWVTPATAAVDKQKSLE